LSRKIDGVVLPPTTGEVFLSFGYACVFGALGVPSIFELKDVIPLALRLLLPLKYAMQAYTIATALIAGIAWLILFYILWHRLERCADHRARLLLALRWIAIAVAVFVLVFISHILLDMHFATFDV